MASEVKEEPRSFSEAVQIGRQLQAAAMNSIHDDNGREFMIVPENTRIVQVPRLQLETFKMSLANLDSFNAAVNRFKTEDTIIYFGPDWVVAILDHPAPEYVNPMNVTRRREISCSLQHSDDAVAFLRFNGAWKSQEEFAYFLEDYHHCIVAPAAADLLELALTLKGKKSVNWKSGMNLDNGDVSLLYEETTTSKAGQQGDVEFPTQIKVAFDLYAFGAASFPMSLEGRLRWRIDRDAQVRFSIKFPALDRILSKYRAELATVMQEKWFQGTPVYECLETPRAYVTAPETGPQHLVFS